MINNSQEKKKIVPFFKRGGAAKEQDFLITGNETSFTDGSNLNPSPTIEISKNEQDVKDLENLSLEKKSSRSIRKLIEWTNEETEILFDCFLEIGSKWVELAQYLPTKQRFQLHRSDNAIKNRFYCCLRKVQKRINDVQRQKKIMVKRMISFDSILTILEIGKFGSNSFDRRFDEISLNCDKIMEVRNQLVEMAKLPDHIIEDSHVEHVILKFLDCKHSLKFLNINRVKKSAKKAINISEKEEPNTRDGMEHKNSKDTESIQQHLVEDQMRDQMDIDILQDHLFTWNQPNEEPSLLKSCEDVLEGHFKIDNFEQYLL